MGNITGTGAIASLVSAAGSSMCVANARASTQSRSVKQARGSRAAKQERAAKNNEQNTMPTLAWWGAGMIYVCLYELYCEAKIL